jgi:hypothetical protein
MAKKRIPGSGDAKRHVLHGLLLAESAIAQSQTAASYINKRQWDGADVTYHMLVSAAAVCYGRPFQEGSEFSGVPRNKLCKVEGWTPAPSMPFQRAHDELLKMRHMLVAHFDMTAARSAPSNNPSGRPLDDIDVTFSNSELTAFNIFELTPDPKFFICVEALCRLQRNRLRAFVRELLSTWFGQCPVAGTYRVTETGLVAIGNTDARGRVKPQKGSSEGVGS